MVRAAQRYRTVRGTRGGHSAIHLYAGIEQLGAIQSVAPSLGVEVSPIGAGVRDIGGIEHAISAYSGQAMAMSLIIA
jgi:hypothetical protein